MPRLFRKLSYLFLAAFILALGWLGNETYMHVKIAEMRTQVAMLTADIRHQLAENKMSLEDLHEYLAHYDGQGLIRNSSGRLLDSFGHPLQIQLVQKERDGTRKIVVTSLGRDGRLGTKDDYSKEFSFER